MKRVGWLYNEVLDIENIYEAMNDFNRRRPVYRRIKPCYLKAVELSERMREDFAAVIGKPRTKQIHEAGKIRELEIPSYESCVAQLALWRVCGKYIERRIHNNSFSSRRGMGGHKARAKARKFIRQHAKNKAKYCLYFDIKKFYQHIDKRILMSRLEAIFKDPKVLEMFGKVIYSTPKGLPIGYPFSHALANLYLVPLYFLCYSVGKRQYRVSKIFVYMDNWTIFSQYKKVLHEVRRYASGWLGRMGCSMKSDWQIFPTSSRYVNICGFRESAHSTKLYRRIWHRIMRNVDKLRADPENGKLYRSLMSRLGWLKAINRECSKPFEEERGTLWK